MKRPTKKYQKNVSLEEKISFYSVLSANGCRMWTSAVDGGGYPIVWWNGRARRVNRVVLELKLGKRIGKLHALHSCDNPLCIESEHLFVGTHRDNMRDAAKKNRFASRKKPFGELNGMAKLKPAQIAKIRKSKKATGELSRLYRVSKGHINSIRGGRRWGHIC